MTDCAAALVAAEAFALVVQPAQPPAALVASGEQGPAGASSASYKHDQVGAADQWVINHNLGYRPVVNAYSVGGQLMLANIVHIDTNQTRILFDGPVAGYAVCS